MATIHTVFICDNNYSIQTSVALVSMKCNKADSTVYYNYLLCSNVEDNNIKKIKSIESDDFIIDIIKVNINKYSDISDSDKKYLAASRAALLKFDIPNIIKQNRVLYLDGDIIVKKDLSPLYNINLEDHYAAVVPDLPQVLYEKPLFDMGNGRKYFNTGMMVLNLKRMRKENITKKLIDTKRKMIDDKLMDQNVFNIVFGIDTRIVSPVYNLTYLNLKRSAKKYNFSHLNEMFHISYKNLDKLLYDSSIIHFSSKDKPWTFYDVPQADEWIYYFNKSPYGNLNLRRYSKEDKNTNFKSIEIEENDALPIVMASNDNYIKNLSVTLQSIKDNINSKNVLIFIFHSGLKEENINKIMSMENDKCKIKFIKLSKLESDMYSVGHYSVDMYFRWYIAEIMYQFKKVLYIDCDTVCCTDVNELFDVELNGCAVAGCINNQFSVKADYRKDKFGISSDNYINSGVLLIDTRRFIQLDLKNKLFDYVKNGPKLDCPDQDALNVVAKDYIKIIDYKWNVQWHHDFAPGKGKPCFDMNYYQKCLKAPSILHYTSNIKPWFERKRPGAEKFWNFAKRTPFYKELLEAERLGMTESQKKLSESKVSKSTNADVLEMMRILRSIVQKSEIFTKIPMSSIDEKFSSKDYKIRLFFYALKHGDVYAAEHVIQEMYNFQNKNIIDEYEKRIKKIYSSPSMVITRPLRWIIKIFKG